MIVTITVHVKGMRCKRCADSIIKRLSEADGIKDVTVKLVSDEAIVRYDDEKRTKEEIETMIQDLGFLVRSGPDTADTDKKDTTIMQGILYGTIPHIGCIMFIIGSILGVTFLMNWFRPLLMSRFFFHALIALALVIATLSSALYLKKNGMLSWQGIKKKRRYIATMYGSTLIVNIVLFMVVFPLVANISSGSGQITGAAVGIDVMDLEQESVMLRVDIPCPGHAPLINNELGSTDGVISVRYSFPNNFYVDFLPSMTSTEDIVGIDVFRSYPAEIIS